MSLLSVSLSDFEQVALFRGLSSRQMDTLRGFLRRRALPARALVMTQQQMGESAYIVLSGAVKVTIEGESGAHTILTILGPGEVVGEMSLVDSLGRSASVETLEPSVLLWLDRCAFWECLRVMPPMAFNLCEILSRRMRFANAHVQALSSFDVAGRIAFQLLSFAREYGQRDAQGAMCIPFRLTQTDLADLVGASRVRVNRTLSAWKRSQLITQNKDGHFALHDLARLKQRCM